jgi:uncharacterized protein
MNREQLEEIVAEYMDSLTTMTLACCEKARPWVAPVYYARMSLDLVFFSSSNSRHSRAFTENSAASASICGSYETWRDIKGLQMEGCVRPISGLSHKSLAIAAYLKKYPFAKEFISEPLSMSKVVFDKISKVQLYLFAPDTILFLENSEQFGTRWRLDVRHGRSVGNPARV